MRQSPHPDWEILDASDIVGPKDHWIELDNANIEEYIKWNKPAIDYRPYLLGLTPTEGVRMGSGPSYTSPSLPSDVLIHWGLWRKKTGPRKPIKLKLNPIHSEPLPIP